MNVGGKKEAVGDVGILTFHCADNYGAMLQAYGLKTFLGKKGIKADIVPYEPPFMTGRHWWIPCAPLGSISRNMRYCWHGWKRHLGMGRFFFVRKANMRQFRKQYLVPGDIKKIFLISQFRKLPYPYYIVGSDQIWNPDITCGLRRAYFGAFDSSKKEKVIAYAASMGAAVLPDRYCVEFSQFLQNIDAISVREKAAISYIKQFYRGEVIDVPDPVFLLEGKEWRKIEEKPSLKRYILVYMTEYNSQLMEYAERLSKIKNLSILFLKNGADMEGENVIIDAVAGPAQFLGYLHDADYVVTNSFHGTAFSIIYQKKFIVFQHSSVGERINNILFLLELQDRIYPENREEDIGNIDRDIAWNQVERQIEENRSKAERFLLKNIG